LAAVDARSVWAYLRRVGDAPRRVLTSRSEDGGESWGPVGVTNLPNPNSSVAVLGTAEGLLLAYNPSTQGRAALSLARSVDGTQWRVVAELERGEADDEYSYPFLIRGNDGDYHLIYTWQRRRMLHLQFNDAWLGRTRDLRDSRGPDR
jgi:predicted neuraminidase